MYRVYNFSAGPSMLPEAVLRQAQAEMLNWRDLGMSVMELGHRGADFKVVMEETERDLRDLMAIPDNYKVLFLSGGATSQFSMIPLNLLNSRADYVDTGIWSRKAIHEGERYGDVRVVAETQHDSEGRAYIPAQATWECREDADYLHYTPNETIDGVQFSWIPKTNNVPLIADMSSMILSRPLNVTDFGMIYAGAQKNIGQAGVTIVIIREDLIKPSKHLVPALYQYPAQAKELSLCNTPPTYSWYFAGLVFAWLKKQGGVDAMYATNQRKAQKLYGCVDKFADFYRNPIRPDSRSMMNVIFDLPTAELASLFIQEANTSGLTNLKGHRAVGGIRASIYNAMPEAGVDALINFMEDFIQRRG